MTKRKFHHGNLRAALLKLAEQEVEANGVAVLSLRDLAARLGVSRSAPYRHFGSKDELILCLVRSAVEQLRMSYERALDEAATCSQRLRIACKAHLDLALHRPNIFKLIFSSDANWFEISNDLTGPGSPLGLFERLVGDNLRLEGTRERRTAALVCWSLIHGFAMLRMNDDLGKLGSVPLLEDAVLALACSENLVGSALAGGQVLVKRSGN